MKNKTIIGIILMITSATLSCMGQLVWKLATGDQNIILYIIGLTMYGLGGLLLVVAFRFGEVSILHPMLGIGFAVSIVTGSVFLGESIIANKIIGVILILLGLVVMGITSVKRTDNEFDN